MQQIRSRRKKKAPIYIGLGMAVLATLLGIGIYALAAPDEQERMAISGMRLW